MRRDELGRRRMMSWRSHSEVRPIPRRNGRDAILDFREASSSAAPPPCTPERSLRSARTCVGVAEQDDGKRPWSPETPLRAASCGEERLIWMLAPPYA